MNYILQINAFWKRVETYPLKTSSIAVYFALLQKNNSVAWREQFSFHHGDAEELVGITKNTYYDCLKELVKGGYIRFELSNNRVLSGKISINILSQNLGSDLVHELVIDKESTSEANKESSLESTSTLNKPLNNKQKNLKTNKENSAFAPPTLNDVRVFFYEILNSNPEEGEKFFYHYESNGWMVSKNKMKKWEASAQNWVKRVGNFAKKETESERGASAVLRAFGTPVIRQKPIDHRNMGNFTVGN